MSWRVADLTLLLLLACGCARPAGVVFPPLDRPPVWPAPPEAARIRLIGTLSDSRDLKAGESTGEILRAALQGPRPPITFSSPHGLAFRDPGLLAVADSAGGAVHVIDLVRRTHVWISGIPLVASSSGGDDEGEPGDERLIAPVGVAWVGDRLYATDAGRHEVLVFDAGGGFHGRFGSEVLQRPVGIAYAESRQWLYVADGQAHDVAVFAMDGRLIRRFGARGSEPGAFNYPSHLCIDDDRLFVSDGANFRVQVLDLDGGWVGTIGRKGDAAGDMALPKGVATDSEGHVYVVDARFELIQVFDVEGRLLLAFGAEGTRPGRFSLPAGLTIDDHDRIWVADAGNRRIQVFQYVRTAS
jgi:DNA-binding beta-propeller fold protein YncE